MNLQRRMQLIDYLIKNNPDATIRDYYSVAGIPDGCGISKSESSVELHNVPEEKHEQNVDTKRRILYVGRRKIKKYLPLSKSCIA
jgi:hypothetical protein